MRKSKQLILTNDQYGEIVAVLEMIVEIEGINKRIGSLTSREKEILVLVISGKLNKEIAFELGMSENTVKSHRARIMRKMTVGSIAELVRATEKAEFH